MKFPCTGCGACCNRIDKAVKGFGSEALNKSSIYFFPYKWDAKGRCEKLMKDNRCSVYNNRPLLCNIDKLEKISDLPTNMFYAMNISICNSIIKEDKLEEKYLIP